MRGLVREETGRSGPLTSAVAGATARLDMNGSAGYAFSPRERAQPPGLTRVEAAAQHSRQKHQAAEEPITARGRRRQKANPATDSPADREVQSGTARASPPGQSMNSHRMAPMTLQERIAQERCQKCDSQRPADRRSRHSRVNTQLPLVPKCYHSAIRDRRNQGAQRVPSEILARRCRARCSKKVRPAWGRTDSPNSLLRNDQGFSSTT